ncbi:MAG: imidazolonepropionase [Acidobacteria bacterium]|nr:MAG: imidazolonepropionase [Acidobacteriota bacterium]
MIPAGLSFFFRHAGQLLTLSGPPVPRRGPDLGELGILRDGAVLTRGPIIVGVGRTRDLDAEARRMKARAIDCRGRVVMPGFVDSHTHLVFAGSRVDDFEERLRGRTYEEIAASGGGITLSARLLGEASTRELCARACHFLEQLAAHGTTTVEVKTGYGLSAANEMKTLRAIERIRKQSPLEIVPTLLAAHAVPAQYRKRPRAYIDLLARRLMPEVAKNRLAEFIDCFCERVAFSVADCRRALEAGLRHGLIPRLHAEQLSRTGGARLAIDLDAASADHLDHVNRSDIRALARSGVVATLVPGANFHLGLGTYPPARGLIEAGAAVALATDFNPGTSPTLNMQFVLALACSALRMTPAEAISAATINAAYSLRRADRLGSLEPGKQADLAVMEVDDYRKIPYYFAWNHCVMTVKRGWIIYAQDRLGVSGIVS